MVAIFLGKPRIKVLIVDISNPTVGPDPVCTIGLLPSDCVRGEVNLLRFLGRVFNLGNYNVLNGAKSHVEEELLDKIHSQLVWGDVAGKLKPSLCFIRKLQSGSLVINTAKNLYR